MHYAQKGDENVVNDLNGSEKHKADTGVRGRYIANKNSNNNIVISLFQFEFGLISRPRISSMIYVSYCCGCNQVANQFLTRSSLKPGFTIVDLSLWADAIHTTKNKSMIFDYISTI